MNAADRSRRVAELCHAALEREARERPAFVAAACGDDETLRLEVEGLLAQTQSAGSSLSTPMEELAAPVTAGKTRHVTDPHFGRSGAATRDPDAPFVTGEIVAGRYRIVDVLGRGGMGEVYRADDLALGQAVALKFLSRSVERNPERLKRLIAEVRVTRQVSHPSVCRVYDIGSIGSRHFLTMEYVDGEDLASLLRRIGRLPADKALDIARQVCAGLAAAHDRGVIHRDLKPANIMLDGRGKVRVTDFGLAVLAEGTAYPGDHAGTPGYMAPEQRNRGTVSLRTDIYALGLVLYEIFTGRRLLDAGSIHLLQSDPVALRALVGDGHLDPAVERVIIRCVEHDPSHRPESALAVAVALPGSDPLAAALARGDTPSPEVVAAAGENASLSPHAAIALLLVAAVGSLLSTMWQTKDLAFTALRPPFSSEVLGVKAHEILLRLRPAADYSNVASSFDASSAFLRYEVQHQRLAAVPTDLRTVRPSPVSFWQRTSPDILAPSGFPGGVRVSQSDPPATLPGMTIVTTDLEGRLVYFDAKPSEKDDRLPAGTAPPWPQLFHEAGLDLSRFRAAEPAWIPPGWGDARAAWIGDTAERSDVPLRVEAAAYRGSATFFVVAAPWTAKPGADVQPFPGQTSATIGLTMVAAAIFVTVVLMARRSIKSRRADRRGAARLAGFVALGQLVATLLVMAHVPSLSEVRLIAGAMVWPLVVALSVWLLFVALEPYIRATWPHALISWNRVIDGRVRDVRVSRDVLIGVAATGAIFTLEQFMAPLMKPVLPRDLNTLDWLAVSSLRETVAATANSIDANIFGAFMLLFFYCLVRRIVRRDGVAMIVFALVVTTALVTMAYAWAVITSAQAAILLLQGTVSVVVLTFMLVQFGLVAVVAHGLSMSLLTWVVTLDPSAWYAGPSLVKLVVVLLMAVYGASTCLVAARTSKTAPMSRSRLNAV